MRFISLLIIVFFSSMTIHAKERTEEFLVNGKCDMCQERIVMAALSLSGVTKANWNIDTKIATITFDDSKTELDSIHASIAKAGHDTKLYKADDEIYENLLACCKYDRNKLVAPAKPNRHIHK
ncbi:heavy-metal-associated domain-containing protein [Dysgonomonas mossii]|uniref:Copper chaperone n=2 Tax=Dysgonomonas mossii TaxID=163665 RepID=A0A4Y9IL06_9BACT|nr:heavy-metal-associated domain-containing protein [Dysgonomonas mossii]TFU88966.1 copper chaperone [Dysgonomonas mossii]